VTTEPFLTNVDIANRALQHCGVTRITAFTDNSKNAASMAFVYDKIRRAELRRNVWRFAVRRVALRPYDVGTLLFVPNAWSSALSYQAGQIVADANGDYWVSLIGSNLNNTPGASAQWDSYFGPLTVEPYDTTGTTGYFTGEMVYESPAAGVVNIYSSLSTANSADPKTPTAWSSTTTFNKGQVVQYTDGFFYLSLIDQNLDNTPGAYPMFDLNTTYAQSKVVGCTDGNLYISMVGSNLGNNPLTDSGTNWQKNGSLLPWTPTFDAPTCGNAWVRQYGTVQNPNIIYPLGSGPAYDSSTRNIFRLPNGYLRQAPQDPKAGAYSYLGAPTGLPYNDWNLEGNYIVSADATPILLRFVADVTYVPAMDDMFCEGLAARIATETCEELTQSGDKLKNIAAAYKWFMGEARTVNGIETGPTEAPEDEFIVVRR
jgi:hypothetical protein